MMDRAVYEFAGLVFGVISCGIAFVLLLCLERTRANIAHAVTWFAGGIAYATTFPFVDNVNESDPGWPARLQGLAEVGVLVGAAIYVASLFAKSRPTTRASALVPWLVRIGWAQAAWLAIASVAFPAQRLNDYELSAFDRAAHDEPGFWLFAVTWILIGINYVTAWVLLGARRLDPAESSRALASAAAATGLVFATAVPPEPAVVLGIAALVLMLWGQFQYVAAQAQRAGFLGQFLSPQVSAMVEAKGISTVMRPHQVELSVLSCDLRDFTPYAEGVPSQAVVDLLAEYYDAVGEAVGRYGGTITSYAGDGVLMLIGAPLPRADHAEAAVKLADDLIRTVDPVLERWATKMHPLGLGVGVATGLVTVGTIGSSSRMEYTAVGTAVNLAARLCSAARSGEVLIDERTVDLAGDTRVVAREAIPVKGLSGLQAVYALGVERPMSDQPGSTS